MSPLSLRLDSSSTPLADSSGRRRRLRRSRFKDPREKRDAFLVIFYLLYYICTLLFQSVPERLIPVPISSAQIRIIIGATGDCPARRVTQKKTKMRLLADDERARASCNATHPRVECCFASTAAAHTTIVMIVVVALCWG